MMMKKQQGLVQFLVLVIVTVMVFVLAGFNLRENLTPKTIKQHATTSQQFAVDVYKDRLEKPLTQYVYQPTGRVLGLIEDYLITPISLNIQAVLEDQPTDIEKLINKYFS